MTAPDRHGRTAYRAWSSVSLRWADNDVYGHVNNTVYYQWFDCAVNSWLIGEGLLDIQHGDLIGLVVATGCDYFAPLTFPGTVDIGLAVEHIGRSSVTYLLGVFAQGMVEPAAQGRFTHVYVDRASRRPTDLPAKWRGVLERI